MSFVASNPKDSAERAHESPPGRGSCCCCGCGDGVGAWLHGRPRRMLLASTLWSRSLLKQVWPSTRETPVSPVASSGDIVDRASRGSGLSARFSDLDLVG